MVFIKRVWINQKKKMKTCMTKQEQINHWVQQYLQAKASGDKTKMKIYESVILKLGGKIPKL
jgi:uncharacterized membrane protein YbaN (DUF454 family)